MAYVILYKRYSNKLVMGASETVWVWDKKFIETHAKSYMWRISKFTTKERGKTGRPDREP